jgi:hypothetical protein
LRVGAPRWFPDRAAPTLNRLGRQRACWVLWVWGDPPGSLCHVLCNASAQRATQHQHPRDEVHAPAKQHAPEGRLVGDSLVGRAGPAKKGVVRGRLVKVTRQEKKPAHFPSKLVQAGAASYSQLVHRAGVLASMTFPGGCSPRT